MFMNRCHPDGGTLRRLNESPVAGHHGLDDALVESEGITLGHKKCQPVDCLTNRSAITILNIDTELTH
jgi:hypothetical protein